MRWTAVVPLKLNDASKSRLTPVLPANARVDLIALMVRHVLGVLQALPQIESIVLLAARQPSWWNGVWSDDGGVALNTALSAWRATHGDGPMLVIHGDLPYLATADVAALIEHAEATGAALATDMLGQGTNAIALADGRPFDFRFGADSRMAHLHNQGAMAVIDCPGLARDIDTPSDLAALMASGFMLPES